MEAVIFGSDDQSIFFSLSKMNYAVGYDLKISPITYEVEITTGDNSQVTMISTFFVLPNDKAGIPFCCLSPICHGEKTVTDHFIFDNANTSLILRKSSAFCGLISLFEKGKTFNLYKFEDYIIFVNPKEIFILSEKEDVPTKEQQQTILDIIQKCPNAPKKINIRYL